MWNRDAFFRRFGQSTITPAKEPLMPSTGNPFTEKQTTQPEELLFRKREALPTRNGIQVIVR
jgi:hypothetical protein